MALHRSRRPPARAEAPAPLATGRGRGVQGQGFGMGAARPAQRSQPPALGVQGPGEGVVRMRARVWGSREEGVRVSWGSGWDGGFFEIDSL